MSQNTPNLTQTELATLWSNLPQNAQVLFRTEGPGIPTWRRLLAFDPIETFTLDSADQVHELKSFLNKNRDNLCAGYLSYDLGLAMHQIVSRHNSQIPLAVFQAYNNWLEMDSGFIRIARPGEEFAVSLKHLFEKTALQSQSKPALHFTTSDQQQIYAQNIGKIHDYIRAGDVYQINYTQQLHSKSNEQSRALYAKLIQQHPAEYGCYMETSDLAIHSLSPELFLHYSDGKLTTKPIKGTRPRGQSELEDDQLSGELMNSDKEQAELYMITDLLRNDLGKVSKIGSVKLDALKILSKLPKVWHTYSHISGNIRLDLQPLDALFSMFPGGSITGCPKQRALEVIDELESSSRELYTGSIGYFHPDGDFSFNIAIRTLIQKGSSLTLGSGGGITIDSNWQEEWNELLVKATTFE